MDLHGYTSSDLKIVILAAHGQRAAQPLRFELD